MTDQNEHHYHDPANVTNPEHGSHHIIGPTTYGLVFITLLACTKGVIVILWFMHVKYQSNLIKMTVASGFFTFAVLIVMTLADYISRAWGLW